MANFFTLTLDTTAPATPSILLEGGATFATDQLINATIGTGDGDTTNYQMKIWGSVDPSHNPNIQTTEGASGWITYNALQQVKLSASDGSKTVFLKIRDDVYNESAQASDSIILDTTLPDVTITGPDVNRISKVATKDTSSFTFQVDEAFVEYVVKVVSASGADNTTGTAIGTAFGSTNMAGTGSFPADTPISCSIKGADLQAASALDGAKIIKVFVRNAAGLWSV